MQVRRAWFVGVASALLAAGISFVPARAADAPPPPQQDACAPVDHPETGIQGEITLADQLSGRAGQGYNCRIRPVASNDLAGLGGDIQLTWSDDCAYATVPGNAAAGTTDGVAVLDVRNPADPKLVGAPIREPAWVGKGGQTGIHEGIHVNDARGILVVPVGYSISIYDISRDCRHPRHVNDFAFPAPDDPTRSEQISWGIHSGQLSPDGTLYYATDLGSPQSSIGGPCLTVLDLADLANPQLVLRWDDAHACHDLDFNEDGTLAYVGFYGDTVGEPVMVTGAFVPTAPIHQALNGLMVLDVSDLQHRRPDAQPRVLSELRGGRYHTENYYTSKGPDGRLHRYVMGSEEGFCPGGDARIVNVDDPTKPFEVSQLTLDVNRAPCTSAYNDVDANILLYMAHYHSVDDERDAKLAFFTWYDSGLRVFDISDPAHPVEVAYYKPPITASATKHHDTATSYPHYVPATGQLFFQSKVGGFDVVELDPALRTSPRATNRGWTVPPMVLAPLSAPALPVGAASPPSPVELLCTLVR